MAPSSTTSTLSMRIIRLLLLSVVMLSCAAQRATATQEQASGVQPQQQQQLRSHAQWMSRSLVSNLAAAVPTPAAATATAEEDVDTRGWPVYGNWCGPKHGNGTPIDEIDACRKAHDNCYDSTGVYFQCRCDQEVVRCLGSISSIPTLSLKTRALRAAIVTYFNNTVCKCSKESKLCRPVKTCVCPALG